VTPTDNQNKREDISKMPVSWASEMVAFCSASCLQAYIQKYSGHTAVVVAKVQGTPSETGIKTILHEPFRQDTKPKQELTKIGFKRLENDGEKGDLRSEVGLSPQEKSQQIIYKKLNDLKNKENITKGQENMESISKITTVCDNCRTSIDDQDEKSESIKATLTNPSTKKNQLYHFHDESCLLEFLKKRAMRTKVKKTSKGEILVDMTTD
jgi:hypothetical protein